MAVLVLMALLFIGLVPIQPAQATILSSRFPTQGPVGTSVNVQGTIDVLGGLFHITFDGQPVAFGQAAATSDVVNINFIVPFANGSDMGGSHTIGLVDNATMSTDLASFLVITARTVFGDPARIQEGNSTAVTVNVTGGISSITYEFDLNVTTPTGAFHLDNVSVPTDSLGSGEANVTYPGGFLPAGNTSRVGAYGLVADETAPGVIPGAASGSFVVGLTDKASYERFEIVNIASTGWQAAEEVIIDIRFAGSSVTIGNSAYPALKVADAFGNVTNATDELPVNIATGTYTVTVVNSTGSFGPTVKVPADDQDFEVTVSTAIVVAQVTPPDDPLQRTLTATAKLEISYPNIASSPFNAARFSSITVAVLNASGVKVADVSLAVSDFDASTTNEWNASWKIPKDAQLLDHNLTVEVGQVIDVDGNNGPDPEVLTTGFTVVAAQLDIAISSDNEPADGEKFNRTSTVSLEFRVSYPDSSVFAPADLGSLAVNVTFEDVTFDVANLTLSASDFDAASGNWTVQWIIPFDANVTDDLVATLDQYSFLIRDDEISDPFGNANTTGVDVESEKFNVTAVTLIVPSIGTDQASYEREEQVFIFFRAFYLDGSSVSTGSADFEVERPDGITFTLTATFQPARNRFEVIQFLTAIDPTGIWTVRLNVSALADSASPANVGPNVTLNVTFEVVRAVEVLQVEADAGSLHFRGEIAQFYVVTANRGALLDVTYDAVDVHTPDLLVVSLLATRTAVGVGISRFEYPIPVDATVGTYSLVVSVSVIFPQTVGKGVTLTSFRISDTLSGFIVSVSGDIATILTDVGQIQVDLAAINPVITSISAGVATIQTDVGVIRADVSALNAVVTAIQGDVATVRTDVGTLRGQVTGIEGDVATISTSVGQIQADVSGVADLSPAVGNILTILYIATALALIAAIAAIAAVAVIMRRLAV